MGWLRAILPLYSRRARQLPGVNIPWGWMRLSPEPHRHPNLASKHFKEISKKIQKISKKNWQKSFTNFFETKIRIYFLFRAKSDRSRSKLLKNMLIFRFWGTCFSAKRFFFQVAFGLFWSYLQLNLVEFAWILPLHPTSQPPAGSGFSYTIMHVRVC